MEFNFAKTVEWPFAVAVEVVLQHGFKEWDSDLSAECLTLLGVSLVVEELANQFLDVIVLLDLQPDFDSFEEEDLVVLVDFDARVFGDHWGQLELKVDERLVVQFELGLDQEVAQELHEHGEFPLHVLPLVDLVFVQALALGLEVLQQELFVLLEHLRQRLQLQLLSQLLLVCDELPQKLF